MIKYQIHKKKYDYFLGKLQDFTSTIQSREPDILEYNVFQAPDKYSFVHYIAYADEEIEKKHIASRYVKQFNKKILDCSKDEPVYIELNSQGQALGLVPDTHGEATQTIDTSLYRSEKEVHAVNKLN